MGDSRKAAAEDAEDFEELCSYYGLRTSEVDGRLENILKKMRQEMYASARALTAAQHAHDALRAKQLEKIKTRRELRAKLSIEELEAIDL